MTTQIATTDDAPKPPAKAPVAAGNKLAAFVPSTIDEAWRLAGALASSGMTPRAYGNDQNKIMVGIIAGAEVGLTPFAALQSIAVIGNNPSLWGDGALALVQASGLLTDMEETDDGNEATCRMNRMGRTTPIIRTFSMDDAKKAGLAGKAGPWTQYPARMRQMRARAFAMRDGFADVLKGLHIVEEARDYTPMGVAVPTSAPLTATMLIDQAKPVEPANDGTLSPDNPAAAEGPSDDDRGEAHTDDPRQAIITDMLDRCTRATVTADLHSIMSDWETHALALPDEFADECAKVEKAIAGLKKRLGVTK